MSQFTDFGENKVADWMRGQTLTLPSSWFVALGSAASDSSFTEITVTGYSRTAVTRSLTNWAGTQSDGSTTASSGTSHKTSNNGSISFGSPSGSAVTATHLGLFDASTSGNCWVWMALDNSISVGASAAVSVSAGAVAFVLGLTGGCSDYLANNFIDKFFRAQTFNWPSTLYLAAYTAAPTNAGGGTEVAGGSGYARASLVPSLSALSGTQSAGSTSASTGTGGAISNNSIISYPTATGSWGTVVAEGIMDASSSGNLLFWGTLSTPKSVGTGAPLTHAVNSLTITLA